MLWKHALLGIGLFLASCSEQSEQDAMTDTLAKSIRVGEAATDARPGYGFDLYPGAQVVASMMNGMSLSIRSDASFEEIVTFYEKQLTERKWEIQSRKMTNGKMVLKSVNHASPEELMSIAIAPAEESGRYNLVFIKLLVDN